MLCDASFRVLRTETACKYTYMYRGLAFGWFNET